MADYLWIMMTAVLLVICLILMMILFLYGRQMKSICRQLRIHRLEGSNTDIWLDIVKGPFGDLQKELNFTVKWQRQERKNHKEQEQTFRQLITNVSHDIRTPITSVSGYFQLFLDTDDEEKRAKYAGIITGRLKNFQVMLEEFYDYSKAVSDDSKIEMEMCDIPRLVSESLFLYYKEIEETLGTPEIDFPEKAVYAPAAESEMKRVVQNVIKNALVHGCGSFRVSICEKDSGVQIRFENQTKEKLPENPDRVFERNYKADEARNSSGSGLGLCIAKELIEKMGGRVTAYTLGTEIFGITIELGRC